MSRKLKFLGLALVAALAMSSVAGNAASADVLTSESAMSTTLTGSQTFTDVLKVDAGEVKCGTVTYSGSFTSPTSSILVTPFYAGCTFAGLFAAVEMNTCQFRVNFSAGTSTAGSTDIVCFPGQEITVKAPPIGTAKCVIHIPPQTGLTKVSGRNVGSGIGRELTLDININNIKYSQTAGKAETGNCATADSTTGGTYTGEDTFKGSHPLEGQVGIFLS